MRSSLGCDMNFDQAVTKVLAHEGGFVDHPSDPGGATNYGITVAVARENGYKGDMRDLPLDTAKAIYKARYWDKVRADELPEGVRFAMMDYAVNSGPAAAVKALQRVLGVSDDGVIGPATIAAANAVDGYRLAARLNGHRLRFMTGLPTWPTFGKGWARRIAENLLEI